MQKSSKNSKIQKNDGHFRIPHPQIILKQYSNICENVVYFLSLQYVRWQKSVDGFCKAMQFLKIENGQFRFFFDILQLPYTVILHSEKLTHPTVHFLYKRWPGWQNFVDEKKVFFWDYILYNIRNAYCITMVDIQQCC